MHTTRRPPQLDLLNVFVGDWEWEGEGLIAEGDRALRFSGRRESRWAGSGWYLETREVGHMEGLGESHTLTLWAYDAQAECFRTAYIDSTGTRMTGSARLDTATGTWHCDAISHGGQGTALATGQVRFPDPDTMDWQWTESAGSRTTMKLTGVCRRVHGRVGFARGAGRPHPLAPAELAQFAFLVGDWRCAVRVKTPNGAFATHQATWSARYVLDGHAIADEYREATPAGKLVRLGATHRFFDSRRGTWVMQWHDALNGTSIELGPAELGGVQVDHSSITFKHRVPPDGLIRCTFCDITPNRFRWRGEFSRDEGRTWDEVMVIEAERIL